MLEFRKYVRIYSAEYLRVSEEQLLAMPLKEYLRVTKDKIRDNARFIYLVWFGWAISDEWLDGYRSNETYKVYLRKAAKIFSIMENEFIRFNDYETQDFLAEAKQVLFDQQEGILSEPVEPIFEDGIQFVANFIAWYKRNNHIPLRMW